MTTKQIQEVKLSLEERVSTLETELLQLKQILTKSSQAKSPWWLKIAGSFENDPTFEEAVKLGTQWRKSDQ